MANAQKVFSKPTNFLGTGDSNRVSCGWVRVNHSRVPCEEEELNAYIGTLVQEETLRDR